MASNLEVGYKDIRKFGIGLFVITGIIGGLLLWRERASWPYFWGIGGLSLLLALAWPPALLPVYRFFMWLAEKLAWINTRIILTLVFYLVFTPIGLFMRVIGKDLLDQKLEPERGSYWLPVNKPPFDPEDMKRQF